MLKCPKCESINYIKYGQYKHRQKYKCKKCASIFSEKNYFFKSKAEKELAIMLLNILEIDDHQEKTGYRDFDLTKILPSTNYNESRIKNISIKLRNHKLKHGMPLHPGLKVLVELVDNKIRIITIPKNFRNWIAIGDSKY